jgi:prepilin-type N-terminal cleavage/methylation domain-containing protein
MKKGFSLIELLVVISIIAILAGLTLTATGTYRKNARDTQRKSDLQQYRVALEAYATNNNQIYPINSSGFASACLTALTGYFGGGVCPTDPGTSQYKYTSNSTGDVYLLYGKLETGGYWEICSNGMVGYVELEPTDSSCDLGALPA